MAQPQSPLQSLQCAILNFFDQGPETASARYKALYQAVPSDDIDSIVVDTGTGRERAAVLIQWNSCKVAATLVLLLAAPRNQLRGALGFMSRFYGGLPTVADVKASPSTSVLALYRTAKQAAQRSGETTVLGVNLLDVDMLERGEAGKSTAFSSFAHTFVMGIGPEGLVVWQAWGEHGYRLDHYIERDGARVRPWEEADAFISDFEHIITAAKGPWSAKMNKYYQRCFEVDMLRICGKDGPGKDIVPRCKAWVRVYKIENVNTENINKFTWAASS